MFHVGKKTKFSLLSFWLKTIKKNFFKTTDQRFILFFVQKNLPREKNLCKKVVFVSLFFLSFKFFKLWIIQWKGKKTNNNNSLETISTKPIQRWIEFVRFSFKSSLFVGLLVWLVYVVCGIPFCCYFVYEVALSFWKFQFGRWLITIPVITPEV